MSLISVQRGFCVSLVSVQERIPRVSDEGLGEDPAHIL